VSPRKTDVQGSGPHRSGLGEFDVIERFFTGQRGAPAADAAARPAAARAAVTADADDAAAAPALGAGVVIVGIGDDAAVLRLPADTDLVAAVDTLVEGRHFPAGSPARSIGHRALAVNLSDFAAMGATPAWATLALTIPSVDVEWLAPFAEGLRSLADAHGVALVGGDTTGGPLTVSVQLLGYTPRGFALRRSGARAGDVLAVTGSLGDAGAGLALVQGLLGVPNERAAEILVHRFEYPAPRVQFGLCARGIASAAMDLSDGLAGDLPKLARASGLAAHVHVERLPLSEALRALVPPAQAQDWALGAGDDYELLMAVPPHRYPQLAAAAAAVGLALTSIGDLQSGGGVTWSLNGAEFSPRVQGYDHFR
jgi:thiamine-monophosphate kinase